MFKQLVKRSVSLHQATLAAQALSRLPLGLSSNQILLHPGFNVRVQGVTPMQVRMFG
jgi:predicted choloylglycine hydrolase